MKTCSKCNVEKSLSEFNRKKAAKDGRRAHCRDCQRLSGKTYYTKNREKITARTGRYYQQNKDRYRQLNKEWEQRNPEQSKARSLKYKHANLDACRQRDKDYRLRNMSKDAARTAKRKAAKRQRTPPWLTDQHFAEINQYYEEARRLQTETGEAYHVDHIVPLNGENVSGLHVPWNLQVLPATENLVKSNTWEG